MSTFKIPTFRGLLKTSPKCREKTVIPTKYQKLPKMKNLKLIILRKIPINPDTDWVKSNIQKVATVSKKLPNGNFFM